MSGIPNSVQVPGMYISVDSTRAVTGAAAQKFRALLIGQRLAAGTVAAGRIDMLSDGIAQTWYGKMSMLDLMARKWFLNNATTEVYACALADNGTTKATWTLTMSGPSTAAGTVSLYVDGIQIPVAIPSGTSAADSATLIAAALTADHPVTAAAVSNVVTLTARNAGEVMDTMDVRLNYNTGESLPTGLGCTIATGVTGATNPDIATAITAMGDEKFDVIVCPYQDATNLGKLETELISRYGYAREIQGQSIGAYKPARSVATVADAVTATSSWGNARNGFLSGTIHGYKILESTAEIAAGFAAVVSREFEADEVAPVTGLTIEGLHGPLPAERFTWSQNNTVLSDGVSTFSVDNAGKVHIQKSITNYQTNDTGSPDITWLMLNTPFQIAYLRYSWKIWMSKFQRAKLMTDDSRVEPGQLILTPKTGKSEAVAWARTMERLGKVENIDDFIAKTTAVRNASDPTRLDIVMAPDLVNQFVVGSTIIQFIL